MNQKIKKDVGKNKLDLISVEAIIALGKVLTMGAKKYSDHSWRKGINYSRVYSAAQRHLQAFWGEAPDIDEESKLSHLSHAFCNIMFLITYETNKERYQIFDDRVGSYNNWHPDLTKLIHNEACKYLKLGMKVRVLRKAKSYERDWQNCWAGPMELFIGREFTIEQISKGGVFLKYAGNGWLFPAFVLEIIKE